MTSEPRLQRVLHFLVELSLILVAAATFGLIIFHSASSRIVGIE